MKLCAFIKLHSADYFARILRAPQFFGTQIVLQIGRCHNRFVQSPGFSSFKFSSFIISKNKLLQNLGYADEPQLCWMLEAMLDVIIFLFQLSLGSGWS